MDTTALGEASSEAVELGASMLTWTLGCSPMCWRLQPYVLEAVTPCTRGCNPMHPGASMFIGDNRLMAEAAASPPNPNPNP